MNHKIKISSIVMVKKFLFSLIYLPSYYQTVCYRLLNQSINHNLGYNHLRNSVQTPKLGLFANCKFSFSFLAILLFKKIVIFMINR